MSDNGILGFGAFVTLLVLGGVLFTILEFRKMSRDPAPYTPSLPSPTSGPKAPGTS